MSASPTPDSGPAKTSAELAAEYGLKPDEYQVILDRLGREPLPVELAMYSVMWSEHCSYKSSRLHLRKFPVTGPRVICGPGENAGVIDIDDGQACICKMESHSHPAYIEPCQGAATVGGGIMRDVFPMGARAVALLSVVAAVGILYWLFHRGEARDLWLCIALAMVSGGILGNLYDRLGLHGLVLPDGAGGVARVYAVRDWILLTYQGHNWPNFNVADSLLICGAGMLLVQVFFRPNPTPEH